MNAQEKIANLSPHALEMLDTITRFKDERAIDYDEVLIFLAFGALNFHQPAGELTYLRPVDLAALAEHIQMPKETLRRKAVRLADRGLLEKFGRGYYVKDVRDWLFFRGLAEKGSGVRMTAPPEIGPG